MRRTRERRRSEIEALVRRGLLAAEDQADWLAIARAIGRLLDLAL